jgi:hypothetical protein
MFMYKGQVNWCSTTTQIVSDNRTTAPTTPVPWVWTYVSESLQGPSYGANKSNVWYFARGLFDQWAIPLPFPVGQSHPSVTITAFPNGTASMSIGW